MEHIAIMKKSMGMLPKIISGEKTLESRWYNTKSSPWNKIKAGETVFFKNAGEPVTAKAEVSEVVQIEDLDETKVGLILDRYHKELGIEKSEIGKYFEIMKNKNFVILVWLEDPEVIEPFDIDKTGQGMLSAWMTVEDINMIKK